MLCTADSAAIFSSAPELCTGPNGNCTQIVQLRMPRPTRSQECREGNRKDNPQIVIEAKLAFLLCLRRRESGLGVYRGPHGTDATGADLRRAVLLARLRPSAFPRIAGTRCVWTDPFRLGSFLSGAASQQPVKGQQAKSLRSNSFRPPRPHGALTSTFQNRSQGVSCLRSHG